MSREIKFRVWDAVTKRYVDLSTFTITYDGKLTAVTTSEIMNPVLNQKNYIVEQYTGLKDKNGKEIYEGDILQIDDHILGDFVVVWHNFGWKIKRSVGYESLSVHKSEDCTVIGNIHENSELLGGEK